jgi:hypothetical protein
MENCINIYNEFLESVQNLTSNDTSSHKENIEARLNTFYQSLQNNDTFSIFSMTKIKVFSAKTVETHNVSISLFGEDLTLKQVFNNQTDVIKNQLWELLLNMYIQLERINYNNTERITTLKDVLKKFRQTTSSNVKNDIFKNVLNTDVNNTTNNMLDDIIGSFQDVITNKGNPFESIMGITEMITSKYGNKIENGEVEIDKILGGMSGMLGKGMGDMMGGNEKKEEPVVMDENFSTADVDIGKEEETKENGFNFSKLMPLANMVSKINSIKSKDDVSELKKEMDNFMEKELKVDMSQYKENMDKLEKKLAEAGLKDTMFENVENVENVENIKTLE